MTAEPTTNILVVGIGGQGVMTASEILAEAAIAMDYDVKKTEVAGMAQRGGVVSSHVRFGKRVLSPEIAVGEADVLLGFEAAEAMRWSSHLRHSGVAMVNRLRLTPPVVNLGLFPYPDDPIASMRKAGVKVHAFDAGAVARELGDLRLVNTIMLGAISDLLPFSADVLKEAIVGRFRAKGGKIVEINEQAFDAGRRLGKAEEAAA